jgi:mersacidin/lichenicidin family type 2 lantibiotic
MKFDIIRAWKDEAYRSSLSSEEQAMLPENPAGALELSDAELKTIYGAYTSCSNDCTAPFQSGEAINRTWPGDTSGHVSTVANSCVAGCPD